MKLKRVGVALLTGVTLLSQMVTGGVAAQEALKIGGNFELTGGAASYGTAMNEAVQLAIELKNKDGGVNGAPVEYVNYDNKSDLTESASVATRLIGEGVNAILGPATTGDAKAEIPIISDAKVPVVFPAVTGDGVTLDSAGKVLEYIFRVCFEDSYQGKAAGKYASEKLGAKKAVILSDQSLDYSIGLTKSFTEQFESQGGQVVASEAYATGDTDFSAVLTTLMAQDFDVLYVPGYYTEVGLLIKQAREMGITQPIVGGDGLASPTLIELAGEANVTDVYYTSHFSDQSESPKVQEFLKAYEAKFGKKADTFAALSFDAANLLLDAAERAGSNDPAAITKAIAETKDFEGVTGTFTMDKNHNPVKPAIMLKLNQGKVESVEEVLVN